ncbi:hypothetical protein PCYB_062990 [Plasmodium cynomolgi strain B]|uniref:Merozoite surface protein 7 n=1 Tax=Plasmodium cynomolgi (strain B) TaxID=1120755 RepID=K6V8V9_PLACD|nr:hypothetical protein PCYB_062990 [Plasmodium cynomolgi strain B]GAB65567.1 hypothetical protein PCYB_062990 [Plasmodium cynomolgi strain B]
MGKFSDLAIFYLVFLLNFCLYKKGVQGYGVANGATPNFRSGASNNDHGEQRTKTLNRSNGTHHNVGTLARRYHGAVLGSTGASNLGNSLIRGNADGGSGTTGGTTTTSSDRSPTPSSESSGSLTGTLARFFINAIIKPTVNLVVATEQPQAQEPVPTPQSPSVTPPREAESNTLIDNKKLKLERDQEAQKSVNDVQEEVQDENYDDGDDNRVDEDTDEGTGEGIDDNTDEDADEEIVYRYDSEEEAKINMEEQGFNSLVNDETIHMIHFQEYTDVEEGKEKVEELVQYMTNSFKENEQLVDTLNDFSDDIIMYLQK